MRILALDIGKKYIGIAITDETGILPQPYDTYKRGTLKEDLRFFDDFINKFNVKKIVIGYPVHMDGKESEMSLFVKKFFYKLRHRWAETEVLLWDERLTTEQAEEVLSNSKKKIREKKTLKDKIAASFILRSYLEYQENI